MGTNEEKIGLIADAANRASKYLNCSGCAPAFPRQDAIDALVGFADSLPDGPADARDVLAQLDELGSPATVRTTKGRYFGYVIGNSEPVATAANMLATAWDQNVAVPELAPSAAHLDGIAARWVCELLGLPSSAIASFCGGASIANLTCILAARDTLLARVGWDVQQQGLFCAPSIKVVTSEEIHVSVGKALRNAGIGKDAITAVETDELGRLRAESFPETDHLTLVVLQAGNVNTGFSDPFTEIIPRVHDSGGWVHVDGAFGLWAAASQNQAHHVVGVELADSWATDAHKWLNAPFDSGIAMCAREDDLRRSMAIDAAYISSKSDRALMHLGLQMGQRARGVDTWAIIASRGRSGVAQMVDDLCELANRMAEHLVTGGANLLAPVGLNQMLFSFGSDEDTDKVVAAVQKEGTCWVGGTQWKSRRAMRLSVCDTSASNQDIDESAAAILMCWDALQSGSGGRRGFRQARKSKTLGEFRDGDQSKIAVVSYDARYKSDFKRLNEAWIAEFFEMEETDHKVLDQPEEYIIETGGDILFAVEGDAVAGTCALVKMADGRFDFELAKMAVDPTFRGRGIGQQLGEAIIDRARELGAKTVFLESNTVLAPAISLYRKLGFVETERQPTPYARGNIHMVLDLASLSDGDGGRA
jgi:glutamate/tyrosine decarboxylase-like PLP-dependent enzyme/ribosomal protein S18 acetylase RimI-like enzyme